MGSSIITVSGELGSGKSTVARLLSEKLGVPLTSTGAMQREIAARRGMSTLELNRQAEQEQSLDHQIDAVTREIGVRNTPCIVDSRMAWKFIPSALKVFLTVDEVVAAQRVMSGARVAESHTEDLRSAIEANRARRQSEIRRFTQLYNVVPTDWDHFDLVVNSTALSPEEVCSAILQFNNEDRPRSSVKYLTSPLACFPAERDAHRVVEQLEAGTAPTADHVEVVHVEGVDLVWSGLNRLAAQVRAGARAMEVRPVARGMNGTLPNNLPVSEFLRALPPVSCLEEWEKALAFRFYRYPDWYKASSPT